MTPAEDMKVCSETFCLLHFLIVRKTLLSYFVLFLFYFFYNYAWHNCSNPVDLLLSLQSGNTYIYAHIYPEKYHVYICFLSETVEMQIQGQRCRCYNKMKYKSWNENIEKFRKQWTNSCFILPKKNGSSVETGRSFDVLSFPLN